MSRIGLAYNAHQPWRHQSVLCKGGGLALIHRNDIITRPSKIAFQPTSFELQLVSVQVSHITVLVANVYRPPRCSKTTFLDEFAEMLTLIERGFSEKLIICGDFNLPGLNSISIDDRLSTLLDTHGYQQHVSEPTRCNNLLDLLITPISSEMQTLVSNVTVVSSNDLSDHNLVCQRNLKSQILWLRNQISWPK